MKYILLIYQAKDYNPSALSQEDHKAVAAQYSAISASTNVRAGLPLGLAAEAITVRSATGNVAATPGPYRADATLGGYYELEADSDEDAIRLAAQIPAVAQGGAVEIRPSRVYW